VAAVEFEICLRRRVTGCHNDIIIYINEISAIKRERERESERGREKKKI